MKSTFALLVHRNFVMKFLTVWILGASLFAVSCNAKTLNASPLFKTSSVGFNVSEERIVGGKSAKRDELPWQASLQFRNAGQHFCGGTILGPRWILTSASCAKEMTTASTQVKVGVLRLNDTLAEAPQMQTAFISNIIIHEAYNATTMVNDIALLKLSVPLNLDGVSVSSIPYLRFFEKDLVGPGSLVTVSGWGTTSELGFIPLDLQYVELRIISDDACAKEYSSPFFPNIVDDMMCAAAPGKDWCTGDTAGPLIASIEGKIHLAGVPSWGYECAQAGYSGVYTEVARYSHWIDLKMV